MPRFPATSQPRPGAELLQRPVGGGQSMPLDFFSSPPKPRVETRSKEPRRCPGPWRSPTNQRHRRRGPEAQILDRVDYKPCSPRPVGRALPRQTLHRFIALPARGRVRTFGRKSTPTRISHMEARWRAGWGRAVISSHGRPQRAGAVIP